MGAYHTIKNAILDKNESGQLMSRLTDDTKVINEFISQKLPNLLPSIVTLVGSLIMLFILDWKMTLLTFINDTDIRFNYDSSRSYYAKDIDKYTI